MSVPIFAAGVSAYYLALVGFKKPARRLLDSILLPVIVGLAAKLIVAFYWFRDVGEPARFSGSSARGRAPLAATHTLRSCGKPQRRFPVRQRRICAHIRLLRSLQLGPRLTSHPPVAHSNFRRFHTRRRKPPHHVFCLDDDRHGFSPVGSRSRVGIPRRLDFSALHVATRSMDFLAAFRPPSFFAVRFGCSGGKCLRKTIPAMFRIPRAKYLAIAISVPAAIAYVGPVASYLRARILWTIHGWGKYDPPSPSGFLGVQSISSVWYFIPALVEEIAWRGYSQPRFIRRYGFVRGIFLVGVVWGAFHFFWDFNSYITARDVEMAWWRGFLERFLSATFSPG